MGEANFGNISLKLFVDRNENKIIFGEAGKDFVDLLFHFLSLPVGTVVKLLSKDKMMGSLGKIYGSVEAMNASYMAPNVYKDQFLHGNKVFYKCSGCACLSNDKNVLCTGCYPYQYTGVRMTYIESTKNENAAVIGKGGGYVKELVTYMFIESTISCITLLNNVKDTRAVETLEIYIGKNEAVDLLKASFVTDKVLTSLFLDKQSPSKASADKKR